jgi:hypothetical protein
MRRAGIRVERRMVGIWDGSGEKVAEEEERVDGRGASIVYLQGQRSR